MISIYTYIGMRNSTPFFAAFGSLLFGRAPRSRLQELLGQWPQRPSINQYTEAFGEFIPQALLGRSKEKVNSRQRIFSPSVTFWAFLAQVLERGSSCRDALQRISLTVINLSQIQNRLLDNAIGSTTPIFHDRPIVMLLAVFQPGRTAQKHDARQSKAKFSPREESRSSLHALLKPPSFIDAASRAENPKNCQNFHRVAKLGLAIS